VDQNNYVGRSNLLLEY